MKWQKKKRLQGKQQHYSLIRKLRRDKKTSEDFESMLSALSLEEIIGLKLELAARAIDSRLFGLELWTGMPYIVHEAVFKYAVSSTRTKLECMNFIGMKNQQFYNLWNRYQIDSYFSEEEAED